MGQCAIAHTSQGAHERGWAAPPSDPLAGIEGQGEYALLSRMGGACPDLGAFQLVFIETMNLETFKVFAVQQLAARDTPAPARPVATSRATVRVLCPFRSTLLSILPSRRRWARVEYNTLAAHLTTSPVDIHSLYK